MVWVTLLLSGTKEGCNIRTQCTGSRGLQGELKVHSQMGVQILCPHFITVWTWGASELLLPHLEREPHHLMQTERRERRLGARCQTQEALEAE